MNLIPISSYDEQLTKYDFTKYFINFFKNYTKNNQFILYDIQKQALKILEETKENILICAPTGSGKTLIFQLAILSSLYTLKSNNPFIGQFPPFTAIYIAPTKAVCEQKCLQFQQHFTKQTTNLSLTISYFSSDGDISQKSSLPSSIQSINIFICTPQMCNYLLRKHSNLLKTLSLLLLDQIHLISCQQRGYNLQIIVNTILHLNLSTPNTIRILAVCASVSNKSTIASWLHAHLIQDNKRPVPLKYFTSQNIFYHHRKQIIIFNAVQQLQRKFQQDSLLYQLHRQNQNYLVFCPSRKSTKQYCLSFKQQMQHHPHLFTNPARTLSPQTLTQIQQLLASTKIKTKHLQQCIQKRISFHHAGLQKSQKQLIIKLIKIGWIIIIFCTTTLAQGVNLPVKAVIVIQPTCFHYSKSEIDQMLGRAGRNKKDLIAYCHFVGKPTFVQQFQLIFIKYQQNNNQKLLQLQQIQSNLMKKHFLYDFIFFDININNYDMYNQTHFQQLSQKYSNSLWLLQQQDHQLAKHQLTKQLYKVRQLFKQYQINKGKIKKKLFYNRISISSYIELYKQIKYQPNNQINQYSFLSLICSLNQFTSIYKYNKQQDQLNQLSVTYQNIVPYQFYQIPFSKRFSYQQVCKRNSISKTIFLIQIYLMGQTSILNSTLQRQSKQIIKTFKCICKLINFINQQSHQFKIHNWHSLPIFFWSNLYEKYCSYPYKSNYPQQSILSWSSHLNLPICWQSLLQSDEQHQQHIQFTKNFTSLPQGFFTIRNKILKHNPQSQLHQNRIINASLLDKSKQLFNNYNMELIKSNNSWIMKPKSYIGQICFIVFTEQSTYQYQKDGYYLQVNQNVSYKIIVNFKQNIGMDSIYFLDGLGNIIHYRIK